MDFCDAEAVVRRLKTALSIAGSDSGGGAGVQADLKTFAAIGVHGATAITALTAQNTLSVRAFFPAPAEMVAAQIDVVFDDFDVGAVKIGMLATPDIVAAVACCLRRRETKPFVVYDPVMAASSGDALTRAGFLESLAGLLPLVDLITPNLDEAAAFLSAPRAASEPEMLTQGRALLAFGPGAALIKGGHLEGRESVDWLITADGAHRFAAPRLPSRNLHGTGCTLSSAIAAHIALGADLAHAVQRAKEFVGAAIEAAALVRLGAGPGPLIQITLKQGVGRRRPWLARLSGWSRARRPLSSARSSDGT
jgi:hydroxymethylpyrimidine/phosphomethylpyrimidine kinase